MKVIGIDLGTTGICGVVIDGERGEVILRRAPSENAAGGEGDGAAY